MFSLRPRDVSRRVLAQMVTVGAGTVLVKIPATAKVVATARAFGTSDGLDAYLIALLLPTLVGDTLAGALTSSLVPTFIEVRELQGRAAAVRLYQSVLAAGFGLLLTAALAAGALAPWIFRGIAASFPPEKIARTSSLFWVLLPNVPLAALATCWRAILNTEGRFALPAILPALTPVFALALLFGFGRAWGVYTLAFGTLAGAVVETALLGMAMLARGFPIVPRWFGRNAALNQVIAQYAPVVASVMLLGGAPFIDQSVAAILGAGSVAALNYGTRVSTVLIAIGPSAVATAILPHFSRLTVSTDWRTVRHSVRGYAMIVLAVTIPVIVLMAAFSEPLVRIFYERGQFTGGATAIVTRIQRFSLLQIPTALVMALVLRLIASMKANRVLLRVAAFYAVMNVILDLVLARTMGIAGIPLSTAMVQFSALLYLFRLMRTELTPRLEPLTAGSSLSL